MPDRIMFVQLKTGHDGDTGPSWISVVHFTPTWQSATWRGAVLHKWPRLDRGNFYNIVTDDEYWVSVPERGGAQAAAQPTVDDDARETYQAFLAGAALPGGENWQTALKR